MNASRTLKINKLPEPPPGLSAESVAWWNSLNRDYHFDERELRLLRLAAEAWDDYTKARSVLELEGQTYEDSRGNPRPRPENKIANDSRVAFLKAVRELNLDLTPPDARPPRRDGQR